MVKKYQVQKRPVKTRKKTSHNAAALTSHQRWSVIADKKLSVFYICFFLLALFIRVCYVFSLQHSPLFDSLVMDPAYHEKIALLIYNGDWLAGDEPFYRSPLYMYVLALIYKIFGTDYLIARLFGALTGSISVILIMRIGQRLFGALPAVIAGFIAVFCWPLIYFDGELLTTSFTIMMGLFLLLIFMRVWSAPTFLNVIGFGLFFGLMALTRENYLPIIIIVFLFGLVVCRRLKYSLAFLVSAFLALSPMIVRNQVVLDDYVLITHYTPVNFYIGNNPYSNGRTAIVPFTRGDWYGGVEDVGKIVEKHIGHPPKPSEISTFWMAATLEYIFKNFFSCTPETMVPTPSVYDEPLPPPTDGYCRAFLPLAIKKFFYIFDLREYSNNKEMYFFREQSSVLRLPIFTPFNAFLYIPLGLLGIFLAVITRNKKVIPLYVILVGYIIGLSLGFVNSRIRMPIIVMLIIFTGYAIACLWEQRQKLLPRLSAVAVVAALLLVFNQPKAGARERAGLAGHFMLGNAYLRKGELDEAESHYQKSVRLTVGEYQMRTLFGLAEIELQRGLQQIEQNEVSLAFEHFRRSTEYRESFQAWLNMASIIANGDSGEDPLPYYERAFALSPHNPTIYLGLAQYYQGIGKIDLARENLQKAKQAEGSIDPQMIPLLLQLEQALKP